MSSVCLALETSSATCSVALAAHGETIEDTRALGRTHNEHLLGMIDGLCQRADITPTDISHVLYSAGPGSFTGVRIAASAAMAIALASDARLYCVNSLLALVAAASEPERKQGSGLYLALRRSRKDAYYICAYQLTSHALSQILPPRLVTRKPSLPDLSLHIEQARSQASLDRHNLAAEPLQCWHLVGDEWPWAMDASVDTGYAGDKPKADTLIRMLDDHRFASTFDTAGARSGLPVYVGGADGGDHPWRFAGQ